MAAHRAFAQIPRPVDDRPTVINDPAPSSPIDGPRRDRNAKPEPATPPPPPAPLLPPRQPGQGWIGWSIGSGYGWHNSGPLETSSNLNVDSGFGPTAVGHFGADIGVQMNDRFALSLQTRHQVIPAKSTDPTRADNPHQWAHAAFVRAAYIFPREGAQFYAGGMAGGGQGFRFRIDAQPGANLSTSDTVRGGAFVLGPVLGFILPMLEKLSLVVEARVLAGLPDAAVAGELNLGAQFDIFHL